MEHSVYTRSVAKIFAAHVSLAALTIQIVGGSFLMSMPIGAYAEEGESSGGDSASAQVSEPAPVPEQAPVETAPPTVDQSSSEAASSEVSSSADSSVSSEASSVSADAASSSVASDSSVSSDSSASSDSSTSSGASSVSADASSATASSAGGGSAVSSSTSSDASATTSSSVQGGGVAADLTPNPESDGWTFTDGVATSWLTVSLGTTYIAPQNDQVTVTFNKLPVNPGKISIQEITLTDEQVTALHATSNKAYDITSDMEDGTFAYDLTMPKPEGATNVVVKYAETLDELSAAKEVTQNTAQDMGSVTVENLDHFTIFTVSADTNGTNGTGAYTSTTGPSIVESANKQITTGTFILTVPSGFVFNTGSTVTATTSVIVGSSTCFTFSSATATPTTTTITFTVSGQDSNSGSPKTYCSVSFSGIQMRPTAGTPLASGNITLSGTASIGAATFNTNTFTETVGAFSASVSTIAASPSSVENDGVTTSAITVTIKDAFGNAISGKTVTLAKTSGAGTPTITTVSGTTNASGQASFTVKSTTIATDVFTATNSTDGGNVTSTATVNFVDTTAPTLAQVTPVTTPTNDTTPDYTFSSTEAGTITYGGDCSSVTTSASSGNNTVTFNALSAGAHTNCTVTVTDATGNASSALAVSSFTIDTTAPTLAQITPVTTPTNDTTPDYTFSSNEAGTITYGGDCSSATTSATASNNTVTFSALSAAAHTNCTVTVTDSAGNASATLNVSAFTIDTTTPTLAQVTPVTTPTSDSTPDYTFSTTEAGTITYSGDCTSATTSATVGNNTITFSSLADGAHSNCTIKVTDAASNQSSALNVTSFTVDTTAPTLAQVTPVTTPTNDTTPNYTFSSTEAGTITYGGDCSSATTSASSGNNTVTFTALSAGAHTNCTVTVTDATGNASTALNVSSFSIDVTAPTIAEVTPVTTPTNDATPDYTFSSTEAGTITYGGDCSSATTSASSGNNTVTFTALSAGAHTNCTVTVTDAAGNASSVLNVTSFTVDTTAPTLAEVTPVTTPTNDTTPNYTFSSNEAGTISYGGDCSSPTTSAASGNNTVTFSALSAGAHTNCTITVTDAVGNASTALSVSAFTIDTTAPTIAQVTPVTTPTNDATPDYTFSSNEAGTISYGGDCSSPTTSASSGNNTVTFTALSAGAHTNCTIIVTDAAGNASTTLSVNSFTVDITAPTIAEVTPVTTPTNDTTPNYTFSSNEAGTITYGGDCSSATTSASSGNNTVTFTALSAGAHTNCTVTVTDAAGNASAVLNVSSFTIDTTAPVIASHATVIVEATSAAGAVVTYTAPATSDNVDAAGTASCTAASGTTFVLGNTTVTCNATDAAGNAATSTTFTVTVQDTTAPVIAAHATVTAEATSAAGAVVTYTSPTTSDAVDGAGTASCTAVSGSTFAIGNTTVTCTAAADAAGNVPTSTTFTVTVQDTTAPLIASHANATVEATSSAGAVVTYTSPSTYDVVDGFDTASCTAASGTTFAIGVNTVTCSKTDAHSNVATDVTFTITVQDTTAPVIASHANSTVEATSSAGAVVTYTSPDSTDAVDGTVSADCTAASGSTFAIGVNTVTCSKTDAHSNVATPVTFTITVQDTTAPVIASHADVTAEATSAAGAVVTYTSPTWTDAVDGTGSASCTAASGTTFAIGTTLITCSKTDSHSNIATPVTFTVTVQDTTAPVITITGSSDIHRVINNPYTDSGATATDIVDGTVTVSSSASGSAVDVAVAGVYYIHYNATDAHGNAAIQQTRTVTIEDSSLPLTTTTNADGTISGTVPTTTVTTATTGGGNTVTFTIPAGTVITGPATWDGTISLPVTTGTYVTPSVDPGFSPTVVEAIELGSTGSALNFDTAVRIVFAGQAGKLVGWSSSDGLFRPITTVCNDDTQAGNNGIAYGGNCRIDSGSDLIVWTKHFTAFVVYTQTASSTSTSGGSSTGGARGGGGGGGGGGGKIVNIAPPAFGGPALTMPVLTPSQKTTLCRLQEMVPKYSTSLLSRLINRLARKWSWTTWQVQTGLSDKTLCNN